MPEQGREPTGRPRQGGHGESASPDSGPVSALAARLRTSLGVAATARELAEALWLAEQLGAVEAVVAESRAVPTPRTRAEPEPSAPASPRPETRQDSTDLTQRLHTDRPEPASESPRARRDDDFAPVRVPTATTLPDPLPLQRALRPLQHYRPPVRTRAHRLDEQATAEQAAETGLLLPVLRSDGRREARLRLLMDVSTSTAVWDGAFDELRQICAGVGAFREVAVEYVHLVGDGADARLAAARSRTLEQGGPVRAAEQLRDPTGRQLTLVLSDCAGPAWRSGRMQRLLHHWGQAAPVAVIQPLPQRMWRRTHLPALGGVLRRREGLGARLDFETTEAAAGALAVPVLAPTRTALGTWARLLAGETGMSLPGAAAWARVDHPATAARVAPLAADAQALVGGFRRTASPSAVTLAVYLSAVPLQLPVMQLVQRAMLPRSGPAVLAEVLLSGLLRREGEDWYGFVPGVREELLRLLHRGDALLVMKVAGEYVDRYFGRRSRTFRALIGEAGGEDAGAGELPEAFAEISSLVLGRFGVREHAEGGRRRETFDLVYSEGEARWASWLAYVLGACGCEVNLREWDPLDRESLGAVLERSVGSREGRRALLLVGGWYDPYDEDLVEETTARFAARADVVGVDVHPQHSSVLYGPELEMDLALNRLGEGIARWWLLRHLGIEQDGFAPSVAPGPDYPGPERMVRGEVPERTPGFVVRQDSVAELRNRLSARYPGACAVIGPPASGKSQLAAEYAHRYGGEYDLVWWVRGDAAAGLAELASEFRSGDGAEELLVELGEAGLRLLVVLDSCEDTELVRDLLLTGGHFVITSRASAWEEATDVVRMDSSDAEELIRRALVRIVTSAPDGVGNGFFLAPGWVVTAASVAVPPRPLDSQPDWTMSVSTADGQSYDVVRSVIVEELAFLHVPRAEDPDCLWLTDQPYELVSEAKSYSLSGSGVTAQDTDELIAAPGEAARRGSPVLGHADSAVVGMVGGARHVVRIGALWALGSTPGTADLWQDIVRAHDRHHAERLRQRGLNMTWAGVQTLISERDPYDGDLPPSQEGDLSPAQRIELLGLLAELPPPREAGEAGVLADVPVLGTPVLSWRDGVGPRRDEALVYAALVSARVALQPASARPGLAALTAWINRITENRDVAQRRRIDEILMGEIDVEIQAHPPPDLGASTQFSWQLRTPQWTRSKHPYPTLQQQGEMTADLGAALVGRLPEFGDAWTTRIRFLLPPGLLWELPVEQWQLREVPLGARHQVFVRPGTLWQRQAPERLRRQDAVARGPLRVLRLEGEFFSPFGELESAEPNMVAVACWHNGREILDAARLAGFPLILWDRTRSPGGDCSPFFEEAESLLAESPTALELLEAVRRLRAGAAADPHHPQAAWIRNLGVYYDGPDTRTP